MRDRTHRPDHGGSGVDFSEWATFAAEMRKALLNDGFRVARELQGASVKTT